MTKQISPLRQRMIDDMTIRNMSPSTQKIYIRAVANFSAFHRRSPDKLDVRGCARVSAAPRLPRPRGQARSTRSWVRCDSSTARRSGGAEYRRAHSAMPRRADHLPAVLARDEVVRFLKAVPDLKMRTAFITIYAAGLRVSEVVALTVADIDSARMVIRIRQGKGRKDRYVMLSEQLLGILRDYWKRDAPAALAVSRARPSPADHDALAATGLPACRRGRRARQDRSPCTRCGTALPPICWNRVSTFA